MPIKRHSAEQIVRKLRDGPACLDAAGPLYVLPRNYNLLRWLDRDLEPGHSRRSPRTSIGVPSARSGSKR